MAVEPGPTWTQVRSRIANKKRHHPELDVTDDQRELAALQLEKHIRRIVDTAPPLNPAQLERLRALLAGPKAA